jgi:thiamine-phosphate pyrophosphorylase
MPVQDPTADRRARLAAARLYLVCPPISDRSTTDPATPDASSHEAALTSLLRGAIAGGVDVVQLREKRLPDEELVAVATAARALCEQLGALFVVNDRPHLAREVGADGVHVGQEDMPVEEVRELVGPEMLIGLSTHAPGEIDAVDAGLVDYIGVGPVHATPTKPGRPAVGLELVRHAAAHASVPFFAIGGIDAANASAAIDAGARRLCVLRAIAAAADPEVAARELRGLIDAHPLGA